MDKTKCGFNFAVNNKSSDQVFKIQFCMDSIWWLGDLDLCLFLQELWKQWNLIHKKEGSTYSIVLN